MKRKILLFSLMLLVMSAGVIFAQADSKSPSSFNPQEAWQLSDVQAYYHTLRQNQNTGLVSSADVKQARQGVEQADRMKQGNGLGLNWLSIGPDNVGGRTRAIIVDNTNPSTLYAGSAGGGVWKSTSGGSSWVPMSVDGTIESSITVSCMAQAVNGTLYAGTGESWYDTDGAIGAGGFIGSGIYKSTDGSNFSMIAGTDIWNFVNEISINLSSGRIFVATDAGLFYSDDEVVWNMANDGNANPLNGNATDVCVGSNGIIVAAIDNLGYVSASGDPNAFVNQSTGGAGKLPSSNVSRMEFAVAPSNADIIYASAANGIGSLLNIYRSADAGTTWSVVGPGGSQDFNPFSYSSGSAITFIGKYNNTIKVFPSDADIVVVGGSNMWQGNKISETGYFAWTQATSYQFDPTFPLYVHQGHNDYAFIGGNSTQMYLATDGGITKATQNIGFQRKNKNYKTSQFFSVAFSGQGDVLAGSKDNGTLIITGDGNTAEEAEQVYTGDGGECAISMINTNAMFVTQPNGFIRRTVDNGGNWRTVLDAGMNNVDGAYITPFILWESLFDYNSLDSVIYTADTNYNAGETVIVRSRNHKYPFGYELPTALVKGDKITVQDPVAARMFYGAVGGVWMTDEILDFNIDPNWMQISEFQGTTQALAVSRDGDVLFAGTQEGTLYRMSNIKSYTNDSTPNSIVFDTLYEWPNRVITSLALSPSDPSKLIVTLGNYGNTNYVYGTDEALVDNPTFDSYQGNLPAMPVYTSLVELNNSDRVILGTELGIWSTDATGSNPTWTHETSGIPDVPVFDLKQQTMSQLEFAIPIVSGFDTTYEVFPAINNYGVIYAASHGRGLFRCDNFVSRNDREPIASAFNSTLSLYPNPARESVTLGFTAPSTDMVHIQLFDMGGRILRSTNLNISQAGKNTYSMNLAGLQNGTYLVRVLSGMQTLGVNKLVVR